MNGGVKPGCCGSWLLMANNSPQNAVRTTGETYKHPPRIAAGADAVIPMASASGSTQGRDCHACPISFPPAPICLDLLQYTDMT